MDRIYLDEASEAPLLPEAHEAMLRWIGRPADPSRAYREALEARAEIEEARGAVAGLVGARAREVTFTASATEALNWLVEAACTAHSCIAVSSVEHAAVYDSARRAEDEGRVEVVSITVNESGAIDLDDLEMKMLGDSPPGAVFIQHANHETGTVQPLEEAAAIVGPSGADLIVDAALSAGRIPLDLKTSGASALVISAHKFGGPPGAGALICSRTYRPRPLLLGGNQERARRAGPENVAAIVGLGVAASTVIKDLESEAERERSLTESIWQAIEASISGVSRLGDADARAPHLLSIQIQGVQGEPVVLELDRAGFAVHSGSACSNEILEPSRILETIGVESRENLRLSVGRSTPENIADIFVPELARIVEQLRRLAR